MTLAALVRTRTDQPSPGRHTASAILFLLMAMSLAPGVAAQPDVVAQAGNLCAEAGFNVQCSEFGSLKMENQRDIRGDPITMTITAQINQTYETSGARWVLFSVRHVPEGSSSPISLALSGFTSSFGNVYITSVEQDVPHEINVWVHVVDVPLGTPLALDVLVGASDRGAFRLEALAMPFDRGYEPIADVNGTDHILYSFSLIGVNKESSIVETSSGGPSGGRAIPMAGPMATLVALAALAGVLRRRSQ